jgi:fructose-bisphosphate aldolase, class I
MTHDTSTLRAIAGAMVAPGKGILAADESNATMTKRLEAVGVASSPETRRRFRELLCTAPGIERQISGVILYDETLRQPASDGTPLPQLLAARGILPGIKVDTGAKPLAGSPGETVTEGLDGLRERLAEYYALGARFAKWRAVIAIGRDRPGRAAIDANAHALARYAALCQEAGIVPIVEPEVLMDGDHDLSRCEQATSQTLRALFAQLVSQHVELGAIVLKPNMVVPGAASAEQVSAAEVARRTVGVLARSVPAAVPGVAFLSGGQSDEAAIANLNACNSLGRELPWRLTFSFGRALIASALERWAGREEHVGAAQAVVAERARASGLASVGRYVAEPEPEPEPALA